MYKPFLLSTDTGLDILPLHLRQSPAHTDAHEQTDSPAPWTNHTKMLTNCLNKHLNL